ncbi:Uncharacterized protein QTN25_004168 [Entamoeba marina]
MADRDKVYPSVFRKTFCGYALDQTIKEMSEQEINISEELKNRFWLEFDKAVSETFSNISHTTHIKGSGSYRAIDGTFWEFSIKSPEIKCDTNQIQPKLLHIYSLSSDDGTKKNKKTKR